jgi:hypothetical protein
MNAPLYLERLVGLADDTEQTPLPLATPGVQRYVWESRFGQILIEVTDGQAFVNGQPVEPLTVTQGRPSSSSGSTPDPA